MRRGAALGGTSAALALGLGAALLAAPRPAQAQEPEPAAAESEPPLDGPADAWAAVYDPWEGMNRGIFWFNERVDLYLLEPVARGWDFVAPDPVERALARFFDHLRFPIVFGNQLLQLKPIAAGSDVARFVVNTTVGVAGLFDPAEKIGLVEHDEDFGQTLGYWGVPPGPYFVIPLYGASSVRDATGLAADTFSTVYPWFSPFFVSFAVTGTDVLNDRSRALEQIAQERGSAIDFYAFVRNAHWSNRRAKVRDETEAEAPAETEDDLYYMDDAEEAAE